ncbi:hypothetical protein, partial [Burkholderia cenocepacia]|uniref:hypothetical protein n=1 Tax=Burkholderia cenocepacia TaxID=95486 RepID=UPI001E57E33C
FHLRATPYPFLPIISFRCTFRTQPSRKFRERVPFSESGAYIDQKNGRGDTRTATTATRGVIPKRIAGR